LLEKTIKSYDTQEMLRHRPDKWVNVDFWCLIEHHAMKTYWEVEV
jgi:hypothetical protein